MAKVDPFNVDELRQAIIRNTALLEVWQSGRVSHHNQMIHAGADVVAVMDAQEVVKLAASIQAYSSLLKAVES